MEDNGSSLVLDGALVRSMTKVKRTDREWEVEWMGERERERNADY